MPLIQTLIATRARKLLLAAAAAGAVFTLFTLAGVGSATGPFAGSFGPGESILEATYGPSESAAASADLRQPAVGSRRQNAAARNLDGGTSRQLPSASSPGATPTSPLPRVPGRPVDPRRDATPQGVAPSPGSPAVSAPLVSPPDPPVTTPTLPTLPELPALPALPPLPEVPSVTAPSLPAVPPLPPVPTVPQLPVPTVPGVLP